MNSQKRFQIFAEFYAYYLSEHTNRVSRRLHVIGTSIALILIVVAVATQIWWLAPAAIVQGYAFAWVGHFFFEHNRPATFKHPIYSFMGDWRLWWDTVRGKVPF